MKIQQHINSDTEKFYENTIQARPPPISAKDHLRQLVLHRAGCGVGKDLPPEAASGSH
jgi:hypothetical protein